MIGKIIIAWLLIDVVIVALMVWRGYRKERQNNCVGCLYNDFRVKSGFTVEYCKSNGCFKSERGYENE